MGKNSEQQINEREMTDDEKIQIMNEELEQLQEQEKTEALNSAIALLTSVQVLQLNHLTEHAERVFKYIQNV